MTSGQVSPSQNPPENANQLFDRAVTEFEHGNYQAAIAKLERANQQANPLTTLGGEIQIWLANAYEAVGKNSEAIALCEQLKTHPDRQIRKSAAFVLEIISAPELNKLNANNSEILNLSNSLENSNFGYRSLNLIESKSENRTLELSKPESHTTKYIQADRIALIAGIAIALLLLGFYFYN
jgi:tetratricopeptide (TPR) repeat protein